MRHLSGMRIVTWAALALFAFALATCGGRVNKELLAQAGNIPSSFDVTLIADKDNQFDYDPSGGTNGAPLTEEDLRSALRYRKEQNLPCATVIVKRGMRETANMPNTVESDPISTMSSKPMIVYGTQLATGLPPTTIGQ